MIRILHLRSKCIGCNACVEADRYRWRISRKDGKCTLVNGKEKRGVFSFIAEEDEYESSIRAKNNCPAGIIRIERIRE
jgi:ferredoxin